MLILNKESCVNREKCDMAVPRDMSSSYTREFDFLLSNTIKDIPHIDSEKAYKKNA